MNGKVEPTDIIDALEADLNEVFHGLNARLVELEARVARYDLIFEQAFRDELDRRTSSRIDPPNHHQRGADRLRSIRTRLENEKDLFAKPEAK